MTNPTICNIFDQLDEWRHLPDYQLERRADIYFAMFLPNVLKVHCNLDTDSEIIPEFPLRHGTIGTKLRTNGEDGAWPNQSVKVDYAAFTSDGSEVLLVELKTDMGSLNEKQISNLKKAKGIEFKRLVDGVLCIAKIENMETKHRQKYIHLLARLSELGQVDFPDKVYKRAFPKVLSGIRGALGEVKNNVRPEGMKPRIVYILPQNSSKVKGVADCVITFEEFAKEAEKHGPLGERFAKSLRCWAKVDAGSAPPGAKCP